MITCSLILLLLAIFFVGGLGCPRGTYRYNVFDYLGVAMFYAGLVIFIGRVLYLCWVHLP